MIHNFSDDLKRGEKAEIYLDDFFCHKVVITAASRDEQRRGIDRHFWNPKTNGRHSIEYKTDWTAARTHNAFVETVSVDTANKAGWAYTSEADYLVYRIPGDGEVIYLIRFSQLRSRLADWVKRYPLRSIPNKGYFTSGLLVPLFEFERIADRVY